MALTFYSMSLDAVVAKQFVEVASLSTLMNLSSIGVLTVKDQFIEETKSYDSLQPVKMALTRVGQLYAKTFIEVGEDTTSSITPQSFAELVTWFRAKDLTGILSENQQVSTGSYAWIDYIDNTLSASWRATNNGPIYTTSKFSGGKPGVFFRTSPTSNGLVFNRHMVFNNPFSIQVLFKGRGTSSELLGRSSSFGQVDLRRFRLGVNNIGSYAGAPSADRISLVFSSSISQSAVCTFCYETSASSPIVQFYEGKYDRGKQVTNTASLEINSIGFWQGIGTSGNCTGSIAEICIWSGSLTPLQVQTLYDEYWRVEYPNETFYVA